MPDVIPLVVAGEDPDGGKSMLPTRMPSQRAEIALVGVDEMRNSLTSITKQIQAMLNDLPAPTESDFGVDGIDVSLAVSKEGKVGLLSALQLSAGMQTTITLHLKRR